MGLRRMARPDGRKVNYNPTLTLKLSTKNRCPIHQHNTTHKMHYIRLMRPPSLDEKNNLKLVLTITTDLGDSFLCPAKPVPISVYAQTFESRQSARPSEKVKIDDGTIQWKAGLRVLKLHMLVTGVALRKIQSMRDDEMGLPRIKIVASRNLLEPPLISEIPFDADGQILGLSAAFPWPGREPCYTATREFVPHLDDPFGLQIDEEIGESIDRHVWDAGVVTTGLITDMCRSGDESKWRKMPLLRDMLGSVSPENSLNVIELGCGVGILGIGLATALCRPRSAEPASQASSENESRQIENDELAVSEDETSAEVSIGSVLLTDLPDAEEMTRKNIDPYLCRQKAVAHESLRLDFESLDWEDGKDGVFGPRANSTAWDIIIISDCTYNVDMLPALVKTLSALHKSTKNLGKTGPKVMLATKPRHSSEKALFDLMEAEGWAILENASQLLPVLDMDDEAVEIYLFGKARGQGTDGQDPTVSASKRRRLG